MGPFDVVTGRDHLVSQSATFRILNMYFSPVPTHFPARDHYENYRHILEMKIKEICSFGQRFS